MKNSAFSLIELLVVIAIVALLAAIAVPFYNSYMIRVRASSVVPIIENLMNKSISLAETNGRFGSAYDLGLNPVNTGPDNGSGVVNPQNLNSYFSAA